MCNNLTPHILAYLCLTKVQGVKTPKYGASHILGYYPPFDKLASKDGSINFYLMSKREGQPSNTPPMNLQGKNSINITGLKDYYLDDGKISGYAYGYPPIGETYGTKKPRPNPFADNSKDAFLFLIHQGENDAEPTKIEMLVLQDAKVLAPSYCKMLMMGGFDGQLAELRKQENSL